MWKGSVSRAEFGLPRTGVGVDDGDAYYRRTMKITDVRNECTVAVTG